MIPLDTSLRENNNLGDIERLLLTRLGKSEFKKWARSYAAPYRELMTYYRCALMAMETKFKVLSEEYSLLLDDRNPIETIKTRLKTPESILDKLTRKGYPLTVESIEKNINDVAGVRVICTFPSDIYLLADALEKQDDVRILRRKDYIETPKDNGYRSLHLLIEVPIFLHDQKRSVKAEVQLRTISMDWWASLEHQIRYKKDFSVSEEIGHELLNCAEAAARLDQDMEQIHQRISKKH